MTRILSGIQPSGNLHLGNYFGAIKQQISMQEEGECLFFIADYHALTSLKNPKLLHQYTLEVAATYLALGLDTAKAIIFRQSDIPATTELMWLLGCTTGVGHFLRAHAYKDKVAQGLNPNMGLFAYPLLMAADILLYRATKVPVGQDQLQHLEMAADIAGGFNAAFNTEILLKPKAIFGDSPYIPGTDGRKMSKSYNNTIPIFWESKKQLNKAVNAIVTDSKNPQEEPLDPDSCNAFAIYSLFASSEEQKILAERYKNDRSFLGYGITKQLIVEKMNLQFQKANKLFKHYLSTPTGLSELKLVLANGAKQANEIASETLTACRTAAGLET